MRFAWALVPLLGGLVHVACGDTSGGDPFTEPGGGTGGVAGAPDEPGGAGGQGPEDPTIGGPCLDDGQCDDDVECTFDLCDGEIGRCRHHPNDSACDDETYCNGSEVCDPMLGCRAAAVPTCSDSDTCTIDTCIEATKSCRHEPRDADGDGDPVSACGGDDCRDDDPLVSGSALERCGNLVDDDCDGSVDEADCTSPQHDTCGDALEVDGAGAYELDLAGAAGDYAFSCSENATGLRDVVVAVMVPDDAPVDVDIVATVPVGGVLVAASARCGRASGEIGCAPGVELEDEGSAARLIVRRPEPGTPLAVLVAGSAETKVLLKIAFHESEPPPEHETCGTARPLEEGVVESATLAGVALDLETACPSETGELVYSFELDEPRDVRLRAAALDDFGVPTISLRSAACVEPTDELTCRSASPTELLARALGPGRYFVALAATGPCDAELVLQTEPATEPPDDEGCAAPPELVLGETTQVSLADHVDAIQTGCLVGAPDAARGIELSERSDVLVVQTGSEGDRGATLIATPPCETEAQSLVCRRSSDFPLRTIARNVGPGSLRAVVETEQGNPTSLTAFSRPVGPTVLVHRADDCDDPFEIPETGGRFEGNTQNAFADFEASCDYGGQPAGGAPDQLLRFTVSVPRRMVFDLSGSDYDTLLVVRDDSPCPGAEIPGTCRPGYQASRSYLDVNLDAGTYYLQIDGYNGASGAWTLEVFSAEL